MIIIYIFASERGRLGRTLGRRRRRRRPIRSNGASIQKEQEGRGGEGNDERDLSAGRRLVALLLATTGAAMHGGGLCGAKK